MKLYKKLSMAFAAIAILIAGRAAGQSRPDTLSNSYQQITKKQLTGSFEVITKEQLLHSADPSLLKRLEGITNSLNFNNNLSPVNSANAGTYTLAGQQTNATISRLNIRGRNTAENNGTQPLVVIDGVPNAYSIDNVNPNDVEDITILKDAVACSAWGSRGANGVIVIRTKQGGYNKPLQISFNTNFNFADRPDAFYRQTMSTADFVNAQVYQYTTAGTVIGAADATRPQPFYSPVAELMNQGASTAQIDALKAQDIRNDYNKYLFRDARTQSYYLGFDGGSKKVAYRLSGTYDDLKNNTQYSGGSRLSLSYNTSLKLTDRLTVNGNVNFSQRKIKNQAQDQNIDGSLNTPFYLYTRLSNDDGSPATVPYKYRKAFTDLFPSFDFSYNPLNNIKAGYTNTRLQSLNFNLGADYRLSKILSANVLYDYNKSNGDQGVLNRKNSFYTRELVNFFTAPDGTQPIVPYDNINTPTSGGIYHSSALDNSSQYARGQLKLNKTWNTRHVLDAAAGIEFREAVNSSGNLTYYNYDEKRLIIGNQLDYSGNLNTLFADPVTGLAQARIPYEQNSNEYTIRNAAGYGKASYTYDQRYTFSASVRHDLSGSYDAGSTYYSVGAGWNLDKAAFYHLSWLPELSLRSSYGTAGSVNGRGYNPLLLNYITYGGITGLPVAASSTTALNNNLRPDRTDMFNIGADFGFKGGVVSGSLEYYHKNIQDQLMSNGIDPVTGAVNRISFNTAKLETSGVDLLLNSRNLQRGLFGWTTNFLFSYNQTHLNSSTGANPATAAEAILGSGPTAGYDLSEIFAFKWAGLDPFTGNPRGYANGQTVVVNSAAAYNSIANQSVGSAVVKGSAVPVYFGALRNTLSYGNFSVSANVLYKLGYYFRRPVSDVVQYSALFNGAAQGAEYVQRWQKQGDERNTNVPSQVYPAIVQRDNFYRYSEVNVLKADHIRLQEVNLAYALGKKTWVLKNARIYANISNLGIIWKANKAGLDPEVYDYPNPRTYAIGLSAGF